MSILDGMPSTQEELKAAMEFAVPIVNHAVDQMQLTERQQSVLDLMNEGLSLADILGITKEHRDALLAQGCRFLQVGEIQKARDTLVNLYQLEPHDERVIYALGTSFQLEGDFERAGKLYVQFLALDATNPDGFLRLGECFLGAKEYDNAEHSFDQARALAQKAGNARSLAQAKSMLELVAQRRAQ